MCTATALHVTSKQGAIKTPCDMHTLQFQRLFTATAVVLRKCCDAAKMLLSVEILAETGFIHSHAVLVCYKQA